MRFDLILWAELNSNNYEAGAKWDLRPSLSFTTAVYRLDRTNTRSTDPVDSTRIVRTGSQRINGLEIGLSGRSPRSKHYVNADNNTNMSPGSPRAIRVALVGRL